MNGGTDVSKPDLIVRSAEAPLLTGAASRDLARWSMWRVMTLRERLAYLLSPGVRKMVRQNLESGGEVVSRALLDKTRAEKMRYWQALIDIAGLENWENKSAGDIARAALEQDAHDVSL
jgi:hypothetical protein